MKLNINDEQGIELLPFIFERELKPPFSKGDKDIYDRDTYHNRNNEIIGRLNSADIFIIDPYPFWLNIKDKVCYVFGFSSKKVDWWYPIKPHLKSWMETQLNIKLNVLLCSIKTHI